MYSGLAADRAGCNGKLSFSETTILQNHIISGAVRGGDYSSLALGDGSELITSIDRIGRFCEDLDFFALSAVAHCLRDINSAFASPLSVDVCFEFGNDLSSERARSDLVRSVQKASEIFNVRVGKCHSIYASTTSLTIASIGRRSAIMDQNTASGEIILTSRLGSFRTIYLAEQGHEVENLEEAKKNMISDYAWIAKHANAIKCGSDVSGFGIAGSLSNLATQTNSSVNLLLSEEYFLNSSWGFIECIQADMPNNVRTASNQSNHFLTLREVAGPLVLFLGSNHSALLSELIGRGYQYLKIGEYFSGSNVVKVKYL